MSDNSEVIADALFDELMAELEDAIAARAADHSGHTDVPSPVNSQEDEPLATATPKQATLSNAKSSTASVRHVVEVQRIGEQLLIPEALTLQDAIAVIQARIDFENQDVAISAEIDAPFVFEAAYALHAVLTERYGWTNMVPTPGFFGPEPPRMLSVPVGPGKTIQVPWGRFQLPNITGHLQSGITQKSDDRAVFVIGGKVKRKDEKTVNEIAEATRRHVREHSIYRGTAFRVKLFDKDGERLPMPEPVFLELDERVERELVLPEATARSVKANIDTFIERTSEVRAIGTPLKRGILLAGQFGTGKTMIAHRTAIKAVRNGWTYVVAEAPGELAEVIRLAREYGPAVLFCEDIDRVMRDDNRNTDMDSILNVIDGVESKGTELMVVLTTNELDRITRAMLRPGRLDALIHVGPPDAAAAERLARQYGRGLIAEDEPLTESREALAGKIPAVIREATERSKMYALAESAEGDPLRVTDQALLSAITEMSDHIDLLTPPEPDKRSETVKAAAVIADAVRETGFVPPFPLRPTGHLDRDDLGARDVYRNKDDGSGLEHVAVAREVVEDDLVKA